MRRIVYLLECAVMLAVYGFGLVEIVLRPGLCLAVGSLFAAVYLVDEKAMARSETDAMISAHNDVLCNQERQVGKEP